MDIKNLSNVGGSMRNLLDTEALTTICNQLVILLAEEIQAWYQYWLIQPYMYGPMTPSVRKIFEENGKDELDDHATKLRNRISELQGCVDSIGSFAGVDGMSNCQFHAPFAPYETNKFIIDNINSELCAISAYQSVIVVAKDDVVTTNLLEDILADEQEHYRRLTSIADDLGLQY